MERKIDDDGLARLVAGDSSVASRWTPGTIDALRNTFGLLDCCHNHQDIRSIAALRFRGDPDDADHGHLIVNETHALRVRLTLTAGKPTLTVLELEENPGRD